MTAIGVTSYLLYLGEPILALISSVVFAKLIVFHFIMDYYDKKQRKSSQTLSLKNAKVIHETPILSKLWQRDISKSKSLS
jgi:hypothetical protein